MAINPLVWKSVMGLVTAPFAGHLLAVVGVAVGSSVASYALARKGKADIMKVINRIIWIGCGVLYLDAFFSAGEAIQAIFKF